MLTTDRHNKIIEHPSYHKRMKAILIRKLNKLCY